MYHHQTFTGGSGFNSFRNNGVGGNAPNSERTKDPYEVLGVSRGATKDQIKAAYRRLAMKYHPDRVRCAGPDAEAAKKRATAKFAEISAAYELLSNGTTGEESGASHPSFATAPAAPPTSACRDRYDRPMNMDSFTTRFDPFGFGTFDHFSDPFELFRRTFGDDINGPFQGINMMGAFPPPSFMTGPSSPAMYAPTFGGISFSSTMNNGFPANSASTSYISSTYQVGGAAGTGTSPRMVSTTTTVINGKTTRSRKETLVSPDGTATTTVTSTDDKGNEQHGQFSQRISNLSTINAQNPSGQLQNGSTTLQSRQEEAVANPENTARSTVSSTGNTDGEQRGRFSQRPSNASTVQAGNLSGLGNRRTVKTDNPSGQNRRTVKTGNLNGQVKNGAVCPHSSPQGSSQAVSTKTNSHHRRYRIEGKQHLKKKHSRSHPLATHPVMPPDETSIVDLTSSDGVIDLTSSDLDSKPCESDYAEQDKKEKSKQNEEEGDPTIVARNEPPLDAPPTSVCPTSRKKKSRLGSFCCFPKQR